MPIPECNPEELSDDQLLYIVGTTDAELFRQGMDIKQRYWEVPRAVMHRFGYISFVVAGANEPAILERVLTAYRSIYRPQDLAIGGHIGVYMYHDVFARIAIPPAYGTVALNPFEFVDLTPVQLRIIQTEPQEMEIFLDQFTDVADIEYGIAEPKAPFASMELVVRYLNLARLHLHAASAVLTGGYDFRGAVQCALLASELALKGGAAVQGLDGDQIKKRFDHRLTQLADFVGNAWPCFDCQRVKRVISAQPPYVLNRYFATQPSRLEVGHVVMGAQYIVAEVVRQTSERDFRSCSTPPRLRHYPA